MSELVISCILLGGAYILSNKKNEGFVEETNEVKPNLLKTELNMKIDNKLQNSKDKFNNPNKEVVTHNNMVHFYNNKSNGYDNGKYNNFEGILDNHTGTGSQQIEKEETSQLFKPQNNTQNVWGSQNSNDFYQSRVNESNRFANTKPWEEIKDSPATTDIKSFVESRDKIMPKTVNELRTTNNPKGEYEQNYKSPAYNPGNQYGNLGKITKQSVDTFHVNNNIESFGPAYGLNKEIQKPEQMLTVENRDETNVSYFGARKSENITYINNLENKTHKKQLPSTPFLNVSSVGSNISIKENYGKEGYNLLNNNRNTTQSDYFGNIKGQVFSNVISPIMNSLKPTKKIVNNPNPIGNINSNVKKPMDYKLYDEKLPTTNRQMTSESLNHMNLQKQSSNAYIISNPYLTDTQRQSTNNSYIGNARGINIINKYENNYTTPNIDKTVVNRTPLGNMKMFNSNINVNITGREKEVDRENVIHKSNNSTQIIGERTKNPQHYDYNTNIDETLVSAFKQNPYTHSLNSIA